MNIPLTRPRLERGLCGRDEDAMVRAFAMPLINFFSAVVGVLVS